jgi:hypothetical protein
VKDLRVLQERAQLDIAYNREEWNKFVMAALDLNGPLSCIWWWWCTSNRRIRLSCMDPQISDACLQLERVQRKFLCYMKHSLNVNCTPHDYTPLLSLLNLSSLAERRRFNNISFFNKLLTGSVDSPPLLSLINFRVPVRSTRNNHPFLILFCTRNYLKNEPITRIMKLANEDPLFL